MVAAGGLDRAGVDAGTRVLVRGAGGGIGITAVQLAAGRGAHVTAVTSAAGRARRLRELAATMELIEAVGYRGLTLEAVARRAGTTKPALRRRWRSLQELVIDALAGREPGPAAETGCTWCDVAAQLDALRADLNDPRFGAVVTALLPDLRAEPELQERFVEAVWRPRREACHDFLRRARSRGDLRAGVDLDLMVDLLTAPLITRALFGLPLSPGFGATVFETVARGIGGQAPEHRHDRRP